MATNKQHIQKIMLVLTSGNTLKKLRKKATRRRISLSSQWQPTDSSITHRDLNGQIQGSIFGPSYSNFRIKE